MAQNQASPNFQLLLHVIKNNPDNRDEYISCLTLLPTIREDIQFFFVTLNKEEDFNLVETYIMIISDIFSKKKPTEFNFIKEELLLMIKYLVKINHQLTSFSMHCNFVHILRLLISSFPPNSDRENLLIIRNFIQGTPNIEVSYSAISLFDKELLSEAFNWVTKADDSHLRIPSLLYSFSNILSVYKTYNNVPAEKREYVDSQRIAAGLVSKGETANQIDIIDPSNPKKEVDPNEPIYYNCFDDKSKHAFLINFLYCIQNFYDEVTTTFLTMHFITDVIKAAIDNPDTRNLVAKLMAVMPACDASNVMCVNAQISALLVPASKYLDNFHSDFSKNILTFSKKRANASLFVETMLIMTSYPDRYMSAIYIGLETNMFINNQFIEGTFPTRIKNNELILPILNSIPFLLEKNYIQERNINQILNSLFSILSNPFILNGKLDLALNTIKKINEANFSTYIYRMTLEKSNFLLVPCLVYISQMLINSRNSIQIETREYLAENNIPHYFKYFAVVVCLIESENLKDNDKLTLINFLNMVNCYTISVPPNDENDKNFWVDMNKKFNAMYLLNTYIRSLMDSETRATNLTNIFVQTLSTLFDKDKWFVIAISLLPNQAENKPTLESAMDFIDSSFLEKDNNNNLSYFQYRFVTFYKTRCYFAPSETIDHLESLVKKLKSQEYKLMGPILKLIALVSKQISYEDYIFYANFGQVNSDENINKRKNECKAIFKGIGKLLESTYFYKSEKVFHSVQTEAREAVYEASNNPFIELNSDFLKKMIGYPFFFNSFSKLLNRLNSLKCQKDIDAKVTAIAWVNHLKNHDHDYVYNEEISVEIIKTIEGDKSLFISSIIGSILPEANLNTKDNENNDDADFKMFPIINFIELLAVKGRTKEYIYYDKNPDIIIFFSKYCYSPVDEIRTSSFRFIMNYFSVNFPIIEKRPEDQDPLYYYKENQTSADRKLVFLSLFKRVFCMRKALAKEVFAKVTKLKKRIEMYHILLCKAIVITNFATSNNLLNYNISYDKDQNNAYKNDYTMNMAQTYYNVPNFPMFMNIYNNPNANFNSSYALPNPGDKTNANNRDKNDQIDNDELIPNNVLHAFTCLTFVTSNVSFEAQEVVKLIAIKDIDKFIHFLMEKSSSEFISCVINRIMLTTKLRNAFIDSFITYILRGGVRIGSKKDLNENDIKVKDEEVKFLEFIATSDHSGELNMINKGKLILIIVMLIGISYRSKKRKSLKKNTSLMGILSYIISANNINKKQVDKLPMVIPLNTDDYRQFSHTLYLISNEILKFDMIRFEEFYVICKNCVDLGVDCVVCSIGVLMIHLSKSLSKFGSTTKILMGEKIWSVVSDSLSRPCNRNRRLFANILNHELMIQTIESIDNINKSNIFHYVLESLSESLDDFKRDAVDIVCTLFRYVIQGFTNKDDYLKYLIKNFQEAFNLTTAEKEQRRKDRQKELKTIIEEQEKQSKSLFSKNKPDEDSEEYDLSILAYNVSDENCLRLNQSVLRTLIFIVEISNFNVFGDWRKTKISIVDIAEIIVKGTVVEQQLALELFMKVFKVHSSEEVARSFCKKLSQEDFDELIRRLIPKDLKRVDKNWFEMLVWVYQSFCGNRLINPELKQKLLSISLEISCIEGHKCQKLALQALRIFTS